LLFILIVFFAVNHASAYTVNPLADAHVRAGSPTTNTGNSIQLVTQFQVGAPASEQWIYLKFDLSVPPNEAYSSATLNLYKNLGSGTTPSGTSVYYVADDTWAETGIIWNNKPTPSTLVGSNDQRGTFGGNQTATNPPSLFSYTLSLTPDMVADGILSLTLRETDPVTQIHQFYSRNAAGTTSAQWVPTLNVTTAPAPVPIPGAIWMLGSGLIGFAAIRRKYKLSL